MRIRLLTCMFLCGVLSLLWACVPRPAGPLLPEEHSLAVVGFHQPRQGWEMLSSSRADQGEALPGQLSAELLQELDLMLVDLLGKSSMRTILGPDVTRQCQELVLSRVNVERGRVSGLSYWLDVGRCTQANYLLVPQVLEWREREGGQWGVTEPGMVVLELTLLDIQNQVIARRFQYDERQRSLSEDLFQAGRFFRRGAKWVPTKELVRDGLQEGLRELGL
jgi:hypothetical protein